MGNLHTPSTETHEQKTTGKQKFEASLHHDDIRSGNVGNDGINEKATQHYTRKDDQDDHSLNTENTQKHQENNHEEEEKKRRT